METYKIKDLVITNAYSIGKGDNFNFINYLDTGNLTEGIVDEIKYINIKKEKIPSRAKRVVKLNDILMSTVRPNQKHYGIIKNLIENLVVSTGFAVLTPNQELVDPNYLYKYLTLNKNTEYLQSIAENSTTAYPSIKPSVIGNIEINLPSLKVQRKIGNILATIDDKIELNNKMNETLEEMAQTIFKEWFVNFNFPNEEGKPYKDNGGKMIESELGMIPEGWREYTLRDFIKFIKGKKPQNINGEKTDRKEQYLTIKSYTGSEMLYADIDKTILINEGDLAMVMDGASSGSIFYGKPGIVASTMAKIENKTLSNDFLYFLIKYYEKEIKQHLTGSAIPHVDKEFIFNLRIAIPLNNLNYSIFSNIRNKIINIMNANQTLIKTRDILLPKLMSGEIRVK